MKKISGVTMTEDWGRDNNLPFPCEVVKYRIFDCKVLEELLTSLERTQQKLAKEFIRVRDNLSKGECKANQQDNLERDIQDMTLMGHALARIRADLLSDAWWDEVEGRK